MFSFSSIFPIGTDDFKQNVRVLNLSCTGTAKPACGECYNSLTTDSRGLPLAPHVTRALVFPRREKPRMAKVAVFALPSPHVVFVICVTRSAPSAPASAIRGPQAELAPSGSEYRSGTQEVQVVQEVLTVHTSFFDVVANAKS
jgi:hypothetical protein